jgi:integrating conjugative element protein (TIGR03761 family)
MTNNAVTSSVRTRKATTPKRGVELGKLRSEQEIQLHTRQGIALWNGEKTDTASSEPVRRGAADDEESIITTEGEHEDAKRKGRRFHHHNMRMVAQAAMMIEGDIKQDNPFADYWFDQLIRKVDELQQDIADKLDHLNAFLESKLPASFSYSNAISTKPVTFSVRSGSVVYYRFLFLVLAIDKYVTRVMQATHYGVITTPAKNSNLGEVVRQCRSAISMCASYRHYDVDRNDIAANNQRARDAFEHYKKLQIIPTQEHIEGTVRNQFAPEIHSVSQRNSGDRAQAYFESETSITLNV